MTYKNFADRDRTVCQQLSKEVMIIKVMFDDQNFMAPELKIYLDCVQSEIRIWVNLLNNLVECDSCCVKTDRNKKKWNKFINSTLMRIKNSLMNRENDFNPDYTY